jgi:hypothetical protein
MVHEELQENLSSEEKKFSFYMTRGQEFIGIEIYRNARKYFKQALEMNVNNQQALMKLKETNDLIKKENRIFFAIAVVAVVLGVFMICLNHFL